MRGVHCLTLELSLYVNRNCQIGVHGQAPGGGTCTIAGDANAVSYACIHLDEQPEFDDKITQKILNDAPPGE